MQRCVLSSVFQADAGNFNTTLCDWRCCAILRPCATGAAAQVRQHGMVYSRMVGGLRGANVQLNRKARGEADAVRESLTT